MGKYANMKLTCEDDEKSKRLIISMMELFGVRKTLSVIYELKELLNRIED